MSAKRRFCRRCKAEPPAERIEAVPETRLCVACSQAAGGEFAVTVTPETSPSRAADRRHLPFPLSDNVLEVAAVVG